MTRRPGPRPILQTIGSEAAARWLGLLALEPTAARWYVEITLAAAGETMFQLNIYAEEWGFAFHHAGQASWIRVTDVPFVHGRDDFTLLPQTPDLLAIFTFVAQLEAQNTIELPRAEAAIRTNLANADDTIREWLVQPTPYAAKRATVEL